MCRISCENARSIAGACSRRCSSTEAPKEKLPFAPWSTTSRSARSLACSASCSAIAAIIAWETMFPLGLSRMMRSRPPLSRISARASATARLPPPRARDLRQDFLDQLLVESRALGDPPAQPGKVDLALRLLAEVEGGEPCGGLGGHVQGQPGAAGLAVRVPVREL